MSLNVLLWVFDIPQKCSNDIVLIAAHYTLIVSVGVIVKKIYSEVTALEPSNFLVKMKVYNLLQ